jgi:hypothetical protein
LLTIALLLFACGDEGESDEPEVGITPRVPAPTETKPSAPSPPTAGTALPVADEPVAFMTRDGVTLRGHLYSNAGPKRKVLVLASTLEQRLWRDDAKDFVDAGVALLTFDSRGVGETGGARNDAQAVADIELAVEYIKSREYPLVYVVGIGAPISTAALRIAATQDLAGVGGLPAGGVSTDEITRVTESKLLMAFTIDTESVQNIERLMQVARDPKTRVIFQDTPAQPPQDILSIPAVKQAILEFVTR